MAISSAMGNAIVPESYGFRNKIINGNFMINQRGYTSASNLASGAYGFDRWKSNYTNTTLTFNSAPQGQLVTISASGVIRQIVERANIQPGSYVLSWKGTATGRVYNDGASAPSYATGPLSVYLDGTANVIVEFTPASGTATLGDVQLELGSRATPFEQRPIGIELALCQRYFERIVSIPQIMGFSAFNGAVFVALMCIRTTNRMRGTVAATAPTVGSIFDTANQTTYTANSWTFESANDQGITARSGGAVGASNGRLLIASGNVFDISAEL